MMQAAIYGRLGGDPKRIDTASGKAMAVGSVAVDVQERNVEDPEPEWLGVVCFGGQADKLLQHAKGETLSVSGRVQRNRWTDRDGNERVQFQVVADALVSARTVRPGGSRRQSSTGTARGATAGLAAVASGEPAGEGEAGSADDFDDDIPF